MVLSKPRKILEVFYITDFEIHPGKQNFRAACFREKSIPVQYQYISNISWLHKERQYTRTRNGLRCSTRTLGRCVKHCSTRSVIFKPVFITPLCLNSWCRIPLSFLSRLIGIYLYRSVSFLRNLFPLSILYVFDCRERLLNGWRKMFPDILFKTVLR